MEALEPLDALVIGAGPAGLMAAEEMARTGRRVMVAEAMPSPGRKMLMAGKSGLNLTMDQEIGPFLACYDEAEDWLAPMLMAFGPGAVEDWAEGLGQPVFTGSSGRVFPEVMKASPLLRAWLVRLEEQGVELRRRWRWKGFSDTAFDFATPGGSRLVVPKVAVLALGGASWPRLGSDGTWASWLAAKGVEIAAFQPANMGFAKDWSPHMAPHFGDPVKGVALMVPGRRLRAEFVITRRGVEGGGIYTLSRALRDGAPLTLDLAPDRDRAGLTARLKKTAKESIGNRLRKAGLSPVQIALAQECARPLPTEAEALCAVLKALPLRLGTPFGLEEAISSAGGIARAALTDRLELRALPGVFAAGEMLDWEAPTGGYLLTASLATGRWAGRAAAGS